MSRMGGKEEKRSNGVKSEMKRSDKFKTGVKLEGERLVKNSGQNDEKQV